MPIVEDGVDPPTVGAVCTRAIVEVGVPPVRIEAVPTLGSIDVPIPAIDDGVLVTAAIEVGPVVPKAEVVDVLVAGSVVPVVGRAVPVAKVDVVPSVVSVVVAEPVVESEVRAGSVASAEAPTPNLAAKELKSVACPKPRLASNASKAGSGAVGVMTPVSGGNEKVLVLGAADVVVTVPPNVALEPCGGICANAAQGVATSATGASQPIILFISPACLTLHVHIDRCSVPVVPALA